MNNIEKKIYKYNYKTKSFKKENRNKLRKDDIVIMKNSHGEIYVAIITSIKSNGDIIEYKIINIPFALTKITYGIEDEDSYYDFEEDYKKIIK